MLPNSFLNEAQLTRMAEITLPREPFIENFGHKFVNFGSCFAQNIKRILDRFGFQSFFVAEMCAHYSTESLLRILEILAAGRPITEDDLLIVDDKVYAYRNFFKIPFRGEHAAELMLKRLTSLYDALRAAILEADTFVFTMGTSRVVRLKSNGQPINSAAGLSSDFWQLDLLQAEENTENLYWICEALTTIRGGRPANLILTVSPQRYLFGHNFQPGAASHEGIALVDNFLSKCALRLSAQKLADAPPAGLRVRYFPAFEIVYEELRPFESIAHYDYCHISQQHTPDLIVKKFLLAYADEGVLDQLSALTGARSLWEAATKLRRGGLSADDPEVSKVISEMLAILDGFGDGSSAPMLDLRLRALEDSGRTLPKAIPEYPFRGQGNLVKWARHLLSDGRGGEAKAILQQVIDFLYWRRTEDPDSGESIEHRVYQDAVALRDSLSAEEVLTPT